MSSKDLLSYYNYFYPYQAIYNWLTYKNTEPFHHRQLSFEYQGGIVQRYVTFGSVSQMKKRMTLGQDNIPLKVDAGAIFSERPMKDNKNQKPQQRQLIFDFDMNDYDDVRTCCQGKNVCSMCWKLLKVAVEVITKTLEEDFGFQKFMYVFSGGRGIHIWVCDERARKLKDSTRKAIIDYLELVTGSDKAESLLAENVLMKTKDTFKQNSDNHREVTQRYMHQLMHPRVNKSLSIIKPKFNEIFREQKCLEYTKCRDIICKILKSRSQLLKQNVLKRWEKYPIITDRTSQIYNELLDQIQIFESSKNNQVYKMRTKGNKIQRVTFIEEQIQLSFLYPRIDHNVSTMRNHLLKLPFSIHPKTKNISVPIFKSKIDQFCPEECLTLSDLMKQLNSLYQDQFDFQNKSHQIVKESRIYQYIRALQDFTNSLA